MSSQPPSSQDTPISQDTPSTTPSSFTPSPPSAKFYAEPFYFDEQGSGEEIDGFVLNGEKFRRFEKLGEGAFGAVYKVVCENRRVFAGKLIKVQKDDDEHSGYSRVKNEIKVFDILRSVEHANVQQSKMYGMMEQQIDGFHKNILVFPLLGPSLFDTLDDAMVDDHKYKKDRNSTAAPMMAFKTSIVREIAQQIAKGMAYLQKYHVLHLDLKLDNVCFANVDPSISYLFHKHSISFITMKHSAVKLVDFGQAQISHHPKVKKIFQATTYRCPELLLGLPYSEVSDVWPFGVLMIEMYNGERLFQSDEKEKRNSEVWTFRNIQLVMGEKVTKELWMEARLEASPELRGSVRNDSVPGDATLPLFTELKRNEEADLLFKCAKRALTINWHDRPTFQQLLQDPYLSGTTDE